MDGSLEADGKTPASFDYNVAVTKEVVAYAHARGATVEGELGNARRDRGRAWLRRSAPHGSGRGRRVRWPTGIDALAVAIGTSHGAYKFAQAPDGEVLKMSLIEEIHRRLPETHLVMHGSSSVRPELVEQINRYGGSLRPAWGVPVKEIQLGIRHGVRKINVDTDSRLAVTGGPQGLCRVTGEVRPARLSQAGPGGDADVDRRADARLRAGRARRGLRGDLARRDAGRIRRATAPL